MGVVGRDELIADAFRHQTAFLLRHPQSNAAKDLESMVFTIQKQPDSPRAAP